MTETNRQCTAHSKQTGERCQRIAQRGFNVCYYHGAHRQPHCNLGVTHPNWKHGRYSKVLRGRDSIGRKMVASLGDPARPRLLWEMMMAEALIDDVITAYADTADFATLHLRLRREMEPEIRRIDAQLRELARPGHGINIRDHWQVTPEAKRAFFERMADIVTCCVPEEHRDEWRAELLGTITVTSAEGTS
jgi:hypothetical protein